MIVNINDNHDFSQKALIFARQNLVLARMLSQRCQAQRDLRKELNLSEPSVGLEKLWANKAKGHRLEAKRILESLEIIAGSRFVRGEPTGLSAKDLNGRDFKNWSSYQAMFTDHLERVDRWSV